MCLNGERIYLYLPHHPRQNMFPISCSCHAISHSVQKRSRGWSSATFTYRIIIHISECAALHVNWILKAFGTTRRIESCFKERSEIIIILFFPASPFTGILHSFAFGAELCDSDVSPFHPRNNKLPIKCFHRLKCHLFVSVWLMK